MTFSQWISNIFSPIPYFLNWLISVSNSLMENYIIVTILCITLSISLFWVFYNFVSFTLKISDKQNRDFDNIKSNTNLNK